MWFKLLRYQHIGIFGWQSKLSLNFITTASCRSEKLRNVCKHTIKRVTVNGSLFQMNLSKYKYLFRTLERKSQMLFRRVKPWLQKYCFDAWISGSWYCPTVKIIELFLYSDEWNENCIQLYRLQKRSRFGYTCISFRISRIATWVAN